MDCLAKKADYKRYATKVLAPLERHTRVRMRQIDFINNKIVTCKQGKWIMTHTGSACTVSTSHACVYASNLTASDVGDDNEASPVGVGGGGSGGGGVGGVGGVVGGTVIARSEGGAAAAAGTAASAVVITAPAAPAESTPSFSATKRNL
jgi:hypothetical protein